jgi:flagellar hook-basal body complex protein FliE
VRVEPLVPDAPPPSPPVSGDSTAFGQLLDALGAVLADANRAEDGFAGGQGTLQEAVYARAQADVALSVATSTAQRIAQAVQSVLNMQV